MKFFVVLVAIIVGLVGLASAGLCARDNQSWTYQSFDTMGDMHAANDQGGRKYLDSKIDGQFSLLFDYIFFLF